ncbi:hypothetical protein [Amycolatopsis sp. NPDC058986]|uniref:hypothetical protein n=1 Tax=unclassified Amycolatopsis TaxID=2618356 RepID=UPI0036732146
MNIVLRRALLTFAAVAAANTLAIPAASADPSTSLSFTAEDGAWPVHGRSAQWTSPAQEINVWENAGVVKVDAEADGGFDYIRIELSDAGGAVLRPGTYPGARFRGQRDAPLATPGIFLVSNGFGCGKEDYADFTVARIERDATGKLTAFDADVDQRCGGPDKPAFRATIRFQA